MKKIKRKKNKAMKIMNPPPKINMNHILMNILRLLLMK